MGEFMLPPRQRWKPVGPQLGPEMPAPPAAEPVTVATATQAVGWR